MKDYTDGCVNFKDVGGYVNLIAEKDILFENLIFRGGSIDYVKEIHEIGNVKSIVNLRNGADYKEFDIDYYHFPMANRIEKYNTELKEVRNWLNEIFQLIQSNDFQFPVLFHCLSGKDRTGVVIAALLSILGVKREIIIEEYLLSIGKVDAGLITSSLDGMSNIEEYFERVDLNVIGNKLKKS